MAHRLFATKAQEAPIDIGVDRGDRKQLANQLSTALADTYVLYAASQAVHWNATGPLFYSLHQLTEAQYEDMAQAIDELAERIRAIGFPAPGGLHRMTAMTVIQRKPDPQTTQEIIRLLVAGNEHSPRTMRDAHNNQQQSDEVRTPDHLTPRIGHH